MFIERNINGETVKFELTTEELTSANAEFVKLFMKNVLIEDFSVNDDIAIKLANESYDLYCEGNGQTEYECVQSVHEKYMKGEI